MASPFRIVNKSDKRRGTCEALRSSLLCGAMMLVTTTLISASGAYAQATGIVTSNLTEGGSSPSSPADLNGNGGPGITILSGNVTIQNANIHNFTEVGGSGSGGGLGAGGVAFVGQGASLTLSNVTVEGNAAIGGLGNTNSPTGGSLNNLGSALSTGGHAATGQAGITWIDSIALFGDGSGNGLGGSDGVQGGSGVGNKQVGGAGGVGGTGEPGWSFNPELEYTLLKDSDQLEEDSALLAKANADAAADGDKAAADGEADASEVEEDAEDLVADGADLAAESEFTDAAIATAEEVQSVEQTIVDGEKTAEEAQLEVADDLEEGADDAEITALEEKVTADEETVDTDTENLAKWEAQNLIGQVGMGGDGGAGGAGGTGDFGLGGGPGGNGGPGGDGGGGAKGGNGGDGGDGGWGGFGAGGGAGGDGGTAGIGLNPDREGGAGGGGLAGFGAGNGASGTGYNHPIQTGGGGGSGLGGAIFVMNGATLTITGNATFGNNVVISGAAAGLEGAGGGYGGSDLFMMTGSTVNLDPCYGMVNACGSTITFNGTIGDDSVADVGAFGTATGGQVGTGAGLNIYSGIVALNGGNLYSGATILDGGVLQAADGTGLPVFSNLTLAGSGNLDQAVFETGTGSFTRSLGTLGGQVQWTGSGGFSAIGQDLTTNISNGQQLVWGQDYFVGGSNSLLFGTLEATNAVHFVNNIQLVGTDDILVTGANTVTPTLEGDVVVNVTTSTPNLDIAYLNGVLSGSGSLTVDGVNGGQLVLTAANTYTGATTIDAGGTLLLAPDPTILGSTAGSIAHSSGVIDNGVFDISGSTGASIVTLSGSGAINLGGQTLTLSDASTTFSGGINGTGGMTVGAGTESFTGNNTYTGATTINSGANIVLTGTGSLATSSDIVDNGTLDISGTSAGTSIVTLSGNGLVILGGENLNVTDGSTTFAGVIEDPPGGSLTISGGAQTLSGTNTYTGETLIDSGASLLLIGTGSISDSSEVVDNGTFDISGTSAGATIITLAGSGSVNLGAETMTLSGADSIFTGVISGSGGLTIASGAELFTGTNTYSGVTLIDSTSDLVLYGAGSIADSQNVVANGILDISATTSGASIVTLSGTGIVTLGNELLTLTDASTTFSGAINGTQGVTVAAGAQVFGGTNTYTGTTTIASGATLALIGTGSVANSSDVVDGGTFDISGTTAGASITTIEGNGTVALGSQYLTLTAASGTFGGVIGGTGGIEVAGGGETLTSTNTYTGTTKIDSGATLTLTGTGSVATSSDVVDNGTFDISDTSAGSKIVSLDGSGQVKLGAQNLTFTAASGTFGGAIAGTGGIEVAGGTEALGGTNSYTGKTMIDTGAILALEGTGSIAASSDVADSGTFDISGTTAGASIETLEGAGSVALGAQKLTLTAAGGTFSGKIGGTGGSLAVTGGTETLSGTNTYSGGTTIANATLNITNDSALGSASGALAMNNGTLVALGTVTSNRMTTLTGTDTFDTNAQSVTLNGTIGGTGNLTTTGGGTLTLAGTNTYSGGTIINGNTTVDVCSDANLGSASGALLINSGRLDVTCAFTTSRNITIDAGGAINSEGNNLNLNGNVVLYPGNGAPEILFTGTVHTTGPWTLDAINGLYVSGTLSGVGNVGTKTTVGGTLSPGNSPGTITLSAPLILTSSSTTLIDVDGTGTGNGAGNYDRVVATGAGNTVTTAGTLVVRLRGITGSANNNFTPSVGERFNVISTTAGVLGSYASLTEPTSGLAPGTQFDTIYSDTGMDLVVTPVSYANLSPLGVTDTTNRMSLGAAINSYRLPPGVRMTGDRNTVLGALYSLPASSIGPTMDQIAGTVYGDAMNTAEVLNAMFASGSDDHRNGANVMISALSVTPNGAFTAINSAAAPQKADLVNAGPFWLRGLGMWSTTKTDGNAPGYHDNAGGLMGGVDIPTDGPLAVGASFGYAQANVTTNNAAKAKVQSERVAGYSDFASGNWRVDGEVAISYQQYGATREIDVGTLTRVAKGDTDGFNVTADAIAHYGLGYVQPFLDLRIDHISRSSFTETNAGDLSLNVKDATLDTPRTMLGVDLDTGKASPYSLGLRLAWAHDFGPDATRTDASLSGSPSAYYTALSSKIGHDAGIVNLSASAHIDDQVSAFVEYGGELRTRQTTQDATVGLRVNW
jgi:autotransporter-associated beta strand protein